MPGSRYPTSSEKSAIKSIGKNPDDDAQLHAQWARYVTKNLEKKKEKRAKTYATIGVHLQRSWTSVA